jgi:hypothetical protein
LGLIEIFSHARKHITGLRVYGFSFYFNNLELVTLRVPLRVLRVLFLGVFMGGSCEQTTEYLLRQWGLWQIYTIGRSNSPMAAVLQLVGGCSKGLDIHITDDQGLMVDRAVAALKARDRDMYLLLELKFIKRYSNRDIEKTLAEDRRVVERRLAGVIGWIDGYINKMYSDAFNGVLKNI